jgi:hypothetical protein
MMQRAFDLRSTGDKAGESVWLRLFDVILELERSVLRKTERLLKLLGVGALTEALMRNLLARA